MSLAEPPITRADAPDPVLDDVVATAFEAAAGRRPWREACESICRAFDAWGVQMLGMFRDTGALVFSFEGGGGMTPQATFDYVTRYHWISPRVGLIPAADAQPWVHDHEHFDEAFVAADPFYQEFLIPYGARWMSVTRLLDEGGVAVYLCLHRGVDAVPTPAVEIARFERVRDGLVRALRVHLGRHRERSLSIAGSAILEVLPQGVLVVDETRLIAYSNPAAEQLLARADGLVTRDGFVDCATERGSRELAAAIRSLGLGGAVLEGGGAQRAVIRLPGSRGSVGQLVFVIAVRPERSMGLFGESPCAVLIVHPLDAPSRPDPFVVALAFGLTPAEARVAAAVAAGQAPEQVAQERGVSLTTVRAQLRVVYEKVGVTRQSDLVRAVLELPRLADPPARTPLPG